MGWRTMTSEGSRVSDLGDRLRRTDPRLLLPSAMLDESAPPDRLELVDLLPLPAGAPGRCVGLLIDPDEQLHVVPLVDDGARVRRARAGDGAALAAIDLLGAGALATAGGRFGVRRGGRRHLVAERAVQEELQATDAEREVYLVGGRVTVTWHLSPEGLAGPRPDLVAHVRAVGYDALLDDVGDLVWSGGSWVGPLVSATASPPDAAAATEALVTAAFADLSAHDGATTAGDLALRIGVALAGLHRALATPGGYGDMPRGQVGAADIARWRGAAADDLTAATVLGGAELGRRLRDLRPQVRDALRPLESALGRATVATGGIDLGAFVLLPGDHIRLAPEVLAAGATLEGRPPAFDLARVLRALVQAGRTAAQRLAPHGSGSDGGRESAAASLRAWCDEVRALTVDSYRAVLAGDDATDRIDDDLLHAAEVVEECRLLARAARSHGVGSAPEATLAELLNGA
jgi:maltokinase